MRLLIDWIFIILSTMMTLSSYNRVFRDRYASVAHYVLLIEYIFMSSPILLNYCMGIPTYASVPWYKSFLSSMHSEEIAIIYDLYVLTSMALLYAYAVKYDRSAAKQNKFEEFKFDGFFSNRIVTNTIILSPIIQVIVTGQVLSYLVYGTSSIRAINSSDFLVYQSMLLQFSICAFCYRFFATPITKGKIFLLLVYSVMIAWISGKRFMIALLLLAYLFCFMRSGLENKLRRKMAISVPLFFAALIVFSYFYLVVIKPVPDTSFAGVYDVLRVDYGRDDVVKFVIEREFFKNDSILDYRGQTILSEFLTFVPRSLWPNKPYPHYVYLTSEILGVARNALPAGTTTSWFEICIANFSWLGFVIGSVSIPLFCKWCDKRKSVIHQMLILIFIAVLITQSMSAYTAVLMFLVAKGAIKLVLGNRRVVIKFSRRR